MSIVVVELSRSRPHTLGKDITSTRIYKVIGSEDPWAVRLAVFEGYQQDPANMPVVVAPVTDEFGLLRITATGDPKGNGVWEYKVQYGLGERQADGTAGNQDHKPNASDPMGMESTFDTTGGTVHLTQSIATVDSVQRPGDARDIPDTKGAIGLSEHSVAGVDVTAPKFTWTETWTFPAAAVNWQYAVQLANMTGRVNDGKWRNFQPGEVLFAGASGQPQGSDRYRVAYTFHAEGNRAGDPAPTDGSKPGNGIVVSPGWDPIDKDGWDYLWVMYEKDPDQTTASPDVPWCAFVEQVYERDDFTKIGIGG